MENVKGGYPGTGKRYLMFSFCCVCQGQCGAEANQYTGRHDNGVRMRNKNKK